MTRDLWLADLKNFDEIADADLPVGDEVQQAKSGGVSQSPKEMIQGKTSLLLCHAMSVSHMA